MIYKTSVPLRIDLAGGTLDIWPIYLLEGFGITITSAINIRAKSALKKRKDKKIIIKSNDFKEAIVFNNISEITFEKFELITRIIDYFKPKFGFELQTEIGLPIGTGLAASSSLGISLMHLFNEIQNKKLSKKQIIYILSNIEAQTIKINTGKQDYFPLTYGGFNVIYFKVDGNYNEKLKISKKFLEKMNDSFIICFTGKSHFSAINNWNIIKKYIDKNKKTCVAMKKIKNTSIELKRAFKNQNFDSMVDLIKQESDNRRNLAKGVFTLEMDVIKKQAEKYGALAVKPLGAGGGGCMLIISKQGMKQNIIKAIEKKGALNIDFNFENKGIIIEKY